MAVSTIPALLNFQPANQMLAQMPGQHRHKGQHASLSDIDAQSTPAPVKKPSAAVGSRLDITA